jgi:hypothetical protein
MAKKAEMMKNVANIFELKFEAFRVGFDLDVERSAQFSEDYSAVGPDFVFAVVTTWIRSRNTENLLDSESMPGNFLVESELFLRDLMNPSGSEVLERHIKCGGWGEWMRGYWERIEQDCATSTDEETYEKLQQLSAWTGDNGDVVVYKYGGRNIVEVCVRASDAQAGYHAWEEYDLSKIASRFKEIQASIKKILLSRCHSALR